MDIFYNFLITIALIPVAFLLLCVVMLVFNVDPLKSVGFVQGIAILYCVAMPRISNSYILPLIKQFIYKQRKK